jgi:hypothetical protein
MKQIPPHWPHWATVDVAIPDPVVVEGQFHPDGQVPRM